MKVMLAGLYAGGSGVQAYTRSLARVLVRQGHEVVLVDRTGEAVDGLPERVAVEALPPPHPRLRRWLGALEARTVQARMKHLVRDLHIDIVHATHPELGVGFRCPTVVTAWDPVVSPLRRAAIARERGEQPWDEMTYGISDWWRCRRASAVVAVSRTVERVMSRRHGCVSWIPVCIPDEDIHAAQSGRSRDCAMAANFLDDPKKGLDLAVEAVTLARRQVPTMGLVLFGGWAEPGHARKLPDFCDVRGFVSRGDLVAGLRRAGCCLLPSVWEEVGVIGLEAMAAGTPLVAPPFPALIDMDNPGLLIAPSRDPESFASVIRRALDIGRFDFPREWRGSVAVPRLIDLYSSLLAA